MDDKKKLLIIGDNIRAERNRARLSQEGLASLVSINPRNLGRIERGQSEPKILTLLSICNALGVSISTICGE